MVLQTTKRINTPSVLNIDALNIKLSVTHLSLRYKGNNRPHIRVCLYIILKLCLCNPKR
jgi:hypothetical protein